MTWWSIVLLATYVVAALLVACLGAFGYAATRQDRDNAIRRFNREAPGSRYYNLYASDYYWRAVRYTAASALLWPVAMPIYFAWKRGTFINDALAARASLLTEEETK